MAKTDAGSGRLATTKELTAFKKIRGLDLPETIDLNQTPLEIMSANPLVGKAVAARIMRLRQKGAIGTPADLYHAGLINAEQLRGLEQISLGRIALRPMITGISTETKRLYVNEQFNIRIDFLRKPLVPAEIISINVRFPSGAMRNAHFWISEEDRLAGRITLRNFVSGESGEFTILATLRDGDGNAHQQAATFGVFTRNPVQMYVTPTYLTQSGSVGAPKYNFSERRWYCYANIRWVNSTGSTVNLGRRVTVAMTDAGSNIGTFNFDLSGDIVIPAWTTVYGNWYTSHGEGGNAYNVYINKGDLTYRYSMSGSGFNPTRDQIWRAMRVIGYNIIRVGDFSGTERSEYQRAASEIASGIFQSRDMTVYGVELYRIEGSPDMELDKARFRFIDGQSEMNDMRSKYTVNNWFLDVFFVEGRWDGAFGSSPSGGPVDKQGNSSGLVLRRDSDTVNLGQTFAHEAGHYLGLEHADVDDGCADTDPSDPNISDNFIFSSSRSDSDVITRCQIDKMRRHGLVHSLTP